MKKIYLLFSILINNNGEINLIKNQYFYEKSKSFVLENKLIIGITTFITILTMYFNVSILKDIYKENKIKKSENKKQDEIILDKDTEKLNKEQKKLLKEIEIIKEKKSKTTNKNQLKELYEEEIDLINQINKISKKLLENENIKNTHFNNFKIPNEKIQESKIIKFINDYIIDKIKKNLTQEEFNEFIYKYNILFTDANNPYIFIILNIESANQKFLNINPLDKKIENIINKFTTKTENNIYIFNKDVRKDIELKELILYQNGTRDNVLGNCGLIAIENGLVHNLFKIKKIGNKDLLKQYYLSLLNYNSFLIKVEKMKAKLSNKEIDLIEEILNTEDIKLLIKNNEKISNIFLKNIKINQILDTNKNLTDEDFYELIKNNIDKITNIIHNIFHKNILGATNIIYSFIFNIYNLSILSTENKDLMKYSIPNNNLNIISNNGNEINIIYPLFNNLLISIIPLQYILMNNFGHVNYNIYSTSEKDHNEVKEFMINWYNWINKKYSNFINIEFIENTY